MCQECMRQELNNIEERNEKVRLDVLVDAYRRTVNKVCSQTDFSQRHPHNKQ